MAITKKKKNQMHRMLTGRVQLQGRVNQFFARLSCPKPIVTVEISTEDSVLATAQGVTFHTVPFGKIKITQKLLYLLTDPKVDFVLTHEVAHIHLNH